MTAIMSSFSRSQLLSLARDAKIELPLTTMRKKELARRLMVARFGMQDAQELKRLEREKALAQKSEFVAFQPAELFLLLSGGPDKVREAAKEAGVSVLPSGSSRKDQTDNPPLGLYVRGEEQDIARMMQWIDNFKQTIQIRQEELMLLDSPDADSNASHYLPAELSQTISRLSRCFLDIASFEDGKLSFSLASVHPQDAERVMLMLRQVQAGILQPADNVGAAAYADDLDTLRQYSMLPFISNEPATWIKLAEDVLTVSITDLAFRVGHVPDHDAYSVSTPTSLPNMKIAGWQSSGEVAFDEPFQQLNTLAAEKFHANEQLSAQHKATLGHVLYTGNSLSLADDNADEKELVSKLQDPLSAPRPGVWLMEYLTNWAREFRSKWGKEASRFVPATFFRNLKNIAIDVWLDRQGWAPIETGSDKATERIVLTYQHDVADSNTKPKLEICLHATEAAEKGEAKTWALKSTRWVSKIESLVMVPERSVDLQLSSQVWNPVAEDVSAQIQAALGPYMQDILSNHLALMQEGDIDVAKVAQTASATTPAPAVRTLPLPPTKMQLDNLGTMVLGNAEKVFVQTYHQRSAGQASSGSQNAGRKGNLDAESASPLEVDTAASHEIEPPSKEHAASSPLLIREIVQDPITEATRESLSVCWNTSPSQHAPEWQSTVPTISSLIDKHDATMR